MATNGDLASVLLFGGLAVFSLLMIALLTRRDAGKPAPDIKASHTWLGVGIGVVAYMAVFLLHPWLFGVSALG